MDEKEVLSLWQFSGSQVEQFEKLENKMMKKWKLGLRWDSKVPKKDKSIFYFFSTRSVHRKSICRDLKDFEKRFRDINTEIENIRGGQNINPKQVQCIREKFEKVITDMKFMNNETDSSTLFNATRDVLKQEHGVFRWFDNVELVQSRKEFQRKKNQLCELEKEESKDQKINTLTDSVHELLAKVPMQALKITELNDQIKDNKDGFKKSSDVIIKLMRKLKYMPFDRSNSEPYEYGTEMQKLVEISISVVHKLNELSVFFEGFRLRENKKEGKIKNLEQILTISSELFISKEINNIKDLISKIVSRRKGGDPNKTTIKRETREDENNGTPSLKFEEDIDDAESDFLENHLIDSYAKSREMRIECTELIKLMPQMVLNAEDSRAKVNAIVIEVLLALNKYMINKLVAIADLLKISGLKEIEYDDMVENIENQLTVAINQIIEEINSIVIQMNLIR